MLWELRAIAGLADRGAIRACLDPARVLMSATTMSTLTATAVSCKAPISAALRTAFRDASAGVSMRDACIEVPSTTLTSIDERPLCWAGPSDGLEGIEN
jgi:hypothetical protein